MPQSRSSSRVVGGCATVLRVLGRVLDPPSRATARAAARTDRRQARRVARRRASPGCRGAAAASPAAAARRAAASPRPLRPAAAAAPPTGTPIKVGVMDDVTGVGAIEGALMRISTDLVVQRTNASGGINGHPVQVTYVDPKGDATRRSISPHSSPSRTTSTYWPVACSAPSAWAFRPGVQAADGLHLH